MDGQPTRHKMVGTRQSLKRPQIHAGDDDVYLITIGASLLPCSNDFRMTVKEIARNCLVRELRRTSSVSSRIFDTGNFSSSNKLFSMLQENGTRSVCTSSFETLKDPSLIKVGAFIGNTWVTTNTTYNVSCT